MEIPMSNQEVKLTVEQREALLVEYECAQNSGQHHDGLVWTVSNMLWGISVVLFGFIVTMPDKEKVLKNGWLVALLVAACFTGFSLVFLAAQFSGQFRRVKKVKYDRCKDIERLLSMKQHTTTPDFKGFQRQTYLFVTIWLCALWVSTAVALIFGKLA
jgi:hypothetical protein